MRSFGTCLLWICVAAGDQMVWCYLSKLLLCVTDCAFRMMTISLVLMLAAMGYFCAYSNSTYNNIAYVLDQCTNWYAFMNRIPAQTTPIRPSERRSPSSVRTLFQLLIRFVNFFFFSYCRVPSSLRDIRRWSTLLCRL